MANISRGSRKDIRDAVTAARKAFPSWAKRSAYNRGQVLYRIAEILEDRRGIFGDEIPAREVAKSIDRLIWYAGWADKYMQICSSINPVAGPYWNFTFPEPTGVVGIVAPEEKPLLGLISKMAPTIVSGNSCVIIPSIASPMTAITFAEVLAASDVPAGVVNIVTGLSEELLTPLAQHMDVNAIDYSGNDDPAITALQKDAASNVKRIVIRRDPKGEGWFDDAKAQSPSWIESLTEMKTAWHPIGL